jgi:(S)-ureidoglycine aminohydrolase
VSFGQGRIHSNIYTIKNDGILFEGENNPMREFKVESISIQPGKSYRSKSKGKEYVIISKSGITAFKTGTLHAGLTPRSIAVVPKGYPFKMTNNHKEATTLYLISYQAKDPAKSSDRTHPLVRLWEDVPFKSHDRGGVQSFFDIHSSETKRLELHLTTLHAGLKSHEPHTHKAEEMIIMIDGHTKMLIGDQYYSGDKNGIYYVESMILHGIENTGTEPCSYFAFQWE